MKVAVIGPGGVGGFVGGVLAKGGHEVSLLARGAHLEALRARGLTVESAQFGTFNVAVRATDNAAELGENELVVLGVKMYDFEDAAAAAKHALAPDGVALTLQNGLDAPTELANVVGRERVLIGTIAIEAAIKEPGVVAHTTPFHQLTVAELEGQPTPRLETLVGQLTATGLAAQGAPDGQQALWHKAAILIPLATLTSAGNLTAGDIVGEPELLRLYDELCTEFKTLAQANGRDVSQALAWVRAQATSVPAMTSSMNRDFQLGRRVELEWLTGRVVHLGREQGVPVPAHSALYALLKHRAQRISENR
ncbi:MAG: 2-dehydropantoate 2-reductase [Chloroflexi bacterium]|nr:2-dehydropantoate 2-reductase [Chloroflexota bacterium]